MQTPYGQVCLISSSLLVATSVCTWVSYRAWTSCNLWELSVDDVLRMRALQPGMLDDIAEHFVQTASRALRSMDATRL
jgi:hypothetical protein